VSRTYTTSDFSYEAPASLIAQRPLPDRAASRLLVLGREDGRITHRRFRDVPELLQPGDLLVLNVSRVLPARLRGTRANGAAAEVLLVHPDADGTWLVMVHPGGKLKAGRVVQFGADATAEVVAVLRGGLRRVRFAGHLDVRGVMERYGAVPLPPYIHRPADAADRERYQTVFAQVDGSVAAPTAGLHFTAQLLEEIRRRGVRVAEVVLHVGPGTFKPVETDDPAAHPMHAEWYEVAQETADAINATHAAGRRVWAVGTTVVRTLETAARRGAAAGSVVACSGWTDVFIRPGFQFAVVDALLTNFHLPRSTLLMLVAAFAGYEHTMAAYREAIAREYRLYSYGDAMAVV
jgi:S-adenosylmethionine:tRNA ribosyltransferase-isomerase